MNTQLRGKMLLKVGGIIYIVFSGFSILAGVLSLIGGGLFLAGGLGAGEGVSAGVGGVAMILGVVLIASSALGLITGILGVKYCERPDKAQTCFVLGIILLVFSVLSLLGNLVSGNSIVSNLIGLALPALYTYGAYLNKQAAPGYDSGMYHNNTYGTYGQSGNMNGQPGNCGQGGSVNGRPQTVDQGADLSGIPGQGSGSGMDQNSGQAQNSGVSLRKPQEGTAPFPDPTMDFQPSADNDNKRTVYLDKDDRH